MKKIGYGIIGCGEHALRAHAIPGKEIPELELMSLCDISLEGMERFAENYGTPLALFQDFRDFFAQDAMNAVVIATPDQFHVENLAAALLASKHVLVEKPLANDLAELEVLRVLLRQAEAKNLTLTSCHPRRYDPPFTWLKQQLAQLKAEFGTVTRFEFDFSYHKPSAAWKGVRSLMLDHLNHEVDLMSFVLGHQGFRAELEGDDFDYYLVSGMRTDDVGFSFHGTRRLETRDFLEWATVAFEHGEVMIDAHTGIAEVRNHSNGRKREEQCGATDYPLRFRSVMQNFADSILGKAPNYLSPQDLWLNNAAGVELKAHGRCSY